jgi:hypothetical protein
LTPPKKSKQEDLALSPTPGPAVVIATGKGEKRSVLNNHTIIEDGIEEDEDILYHEGAVDCGGGGRRAMNEEEDLQAALAASLKDAQQAMGMVEKGKGPSLPLDAAGGTTPTCIPASSTHQQYILDRNQVYQLLLKSKTDWWNGDEIFRIIQTLQAPGADLSSLGVHFTEDLNVNPQPGTIFFLKPQKRNFKQKDGLVPETKEMSVPLSVTGLGNIVLTRQAVCRGDVSRRTYYMTKERDRGIKIIHYLPHKANTLVKAATAFSTQNQPTNRASSFTRMLKNKAEPLHLHRICQICWQKKPCSCSLTSYHLTGSHFCKVCQYLEVKNPKYSGYGWVQPHHPTGRISSSHCTVHKVTVEDSHFLGAMWPIDYCRICYAIGMPPMSASFGFITGGRFAPMVCASHKKEGMQLRPAASCHECDRRATFGRVTNGKFLARYCSIHKKDDLYTHPSKWCEIQGCNISANYGRDEGSGFRATRCEKHKEGRVLRAEFLAMKVLDQCHPGENMEWSDALQEVLVDFRNEDDDEDEDMLLFINNLDQTVRGDGEHVPLHIRLRDKVKDQEEGTILFGDGTGVYCVYLILAKLMNGSEHAYVGLTGQSAEKRLAQHLKAGESDEGAYWARVLGSSESHQLYVLCEGLQKKEGVALEKAMIGVLETYAPRGRRGCNSTRGNTVVDGRLNLAATKDALVALDLAGFCNNSAKMTIQLDFSMR